jgi:signal transduction histidine kinase
MSAKPTDDAFESLVTLNRALLAQHLLRGIAHDLRNHLQVLTLGAVAPGTGPPALAAPLEQAVDAMTTALDLLGSLGRMEPDRDAASDLGAVLADLVRLTELMRNLPEGPVEVDTVPPGLTVATPPAILIQILLNVVANAKEASPAAPAVVRVRIGERRGDRIEVIVEDGGPGLPAEAGQLWRTSRDRHSHGGIGYPVAAGLLARHGGEIRHQATTVNQVVVTLPLTGPG